MPLTLTCSKCQKEYLDFDPYWELDGADGDAISVDVYAARGNGPAIERSYCMSCLLEAVEAVVMHLTPKRD